MRFLWPKRLNCTDIREITAVYGERGITRPGIVKWCKQFNAGRTDLTDEYREGRLATSSTVVNVDRVDGIIREHRRITLQEIVKGKSSCLQVVK